MSSIWDNTYTLGDSSATVISAGPGIKITTDEPGVIKVSNDETVLWSGAYSTATTSVNLSENFNNFEKLEVWWIQQNARPIVHTYQTDNLSQLFCIHGKTENGQAIMFMAGWNKGNDGLSFSKNWCKYTPTHQWGTFYEANELVPVKIIGCNRKQNGGN